MCRRVLSPPLCRVSRGRSEADTAGKTLKQQLAPLFIQDPPTIESARSGGFSAVTE